MEPRRVSMVGIHIICFPPLEQVILSDRLYSFYTFSV